MYLCIDRSIDLSIYLSICKLENEAILRDLLSFWTWQHEKRGKSARHLQFLNLTTSKTKQFCETSSISKCHIKNEAILRDFLQKCKVECRADGLVPVRFAIFQSMCLKYCARHEKVRPRHTKCCTCHANRLSTSEYLMLQNTALWNQRPGLLTSLMNMSLVLRHFSRVPHLPSFLKLLQNPHVFLIFDKVHNPLRLPCETTSERRKVVRARQLLTLLTWKCASRPFSTSQLQKCSESAVLCTFWLGNVLRATTACTFSTSQLPKVVRDHQFLTVLTSKCDSRHTAWTFSTSQFLKVLRSWRILYTLTS